MGTSAGAGPVSLGLLAMLVLLLTCKWDEEQITNYKISNWRGLQHHTTDTKLHKTGKKWVLWQGIHNYEYTDTLTSIDSHGRGLMMYDLINTTHKQWWTQAWTYTVAQIIKSCNHKIKSPEFLSIYYILLFYFIKFTFYSYHISIKIAPIYFPNRCSWYYWEYIISALSMIQSISCAPLYVFLCNFLFKPYIQYVRLWK